MKLAIQMASKQSHILHPTHFITRFIKTYITFDKQAHYQKYLKTM